MSQQDLMKEWFKELPSEQPSPDFQVKVMQRVMSEWTLNPVKYQPIISRKGWWTIALIAMLLTSILLMFYSLLPGGTDPAVQAKTIYGLDLTRILLQISRYFEKLNSISPTVVIGSLAIIALWFFDQLFIKTVKRANR
jgi:hypothetical protein